MPAEIDPGSFLLVCQQFIFAEFLQLRHLVPEACLAGRIGYIEQCDLSADLGLPSRRRLIQQFIHHAEFLTPISGKGVKGTGFDESFDSFTVDRRRHAIDKIFQIPELSAVFTYPDDILHDGTSYTFDRRQSV